MTDAATAEMTEQQLLEALFGGDAPMEVFEAPQFRVIGKCGKCAGTGYLPGYRHVQGGLCFMCHGEGEIRIRI